MPNTATRWSSIVAGPLPALAFVGGVWLLQYMPALPPLSLLAGCLVALAVLYRYTPYRRLIFMVFLLVLGFSYAAGRADWRLRSTLPADLVWQDIQIEGTVYGTPTVHPEERTRFDFIIKRITAPTPLTLNLHVRLNYYLRDGETQSPLLKNGAGLRMSVRLRPPSGSFNPHNFDYAGNLFAQNIRLVGYVRNDITALSAPSSPDIRHRLGERARQSGAHHAALIKALVIGDRDDIDDEAWTVLRRTGTAHLVSISGAHIGFVYLLVTLLILFLWRTNVYLSRRAPAMQAALLLAIPAAFAYAWLAGFGVPVQRSFIMLIVIAGVILVGGTQATLTTLTSAMLAVVIINPWAILSAGFWLSFLLTGVLLFATLTVRPGQSRWWVFLKTQSVLSLLAMPLTLWFFNEASFISPLANIVAIPVIGFIVLPLALGGIAAGDFCWRVAGWVLDGLWHYLDFLAALPFAALSPAQPPLGLFLLAVGGGAWLLMPRGVPWRFAGVLPIIGILLITPPQPAAGALRMTFLDVGQGSAVVLQTANHTLVYDTGRPHGGYIVANYLRGVGVRRLDTLLISHNDHDHRGGSENLLAAFPADTVIASGGDIPCQRGLAWEWDGVAFFALHPEKPLSGDHNDDGCVLAVRTANGDTVLLTGDISATIERQLIAAIPNPPTVLHVAHHGSRFSSDPLFLQATRPKLAVISVGRNNYGHPHPHTLQRLQDIGATVYRTDTAGALVMEMAETISVTTWRDKRLRYWHTE